MEIAIYGAGKLGRYVYRWFTADGRGKYTPKLWIDNKLPEGELYGVPVVTEEEFLKAYTADAVVIAIQNVEIAQRVFLSMKRAGLAEVFFVHRAALDSDLPLLSDSGKFGAFIRRWDAIKPVLPYLEFQVADACNLKCKACMHFSNLVSGERNPDLSEYKCSMEILAERFLSIQKIRLMGGEPLLNPELPHYIEIARHYFPLSDIRVVTNGLLVTSISEELIHTMQSCTALFDISQYPPTRRKLAEIIGFLDKHRIGYFIGKPIEVFQIRMSRGETDYRDVFYNGCLSKTCNFLRGGRLYVCPHIPMLYREKDFFRIAISEKELLDNSIDPAEKDGWEILARLDEPFTMCRYCSKEYKDVKWSTGRASPEDWLV